jgi:NADPH:quinone reductase-like Zn-dependent oxidoreductase
MTKNVATQVDFKPLQNFLTGSNSMSKVMLITGASRGIGAATARLAAARGYALCLNYHR